MSLVSLCTTQYLRFERSTVTVDASGGQVETFSTISGMESVPVSLQAGPAKVASIFGQRQIDYTNSIFSSIDLGLIKGDRGIEISSDRIFVLVAVADMAGRGVAFLYKFREIV